MLDIRRRTGVLLLVVTMAQLILISAQVQSKTGVPVFQAVTFGAFARVQGGTTGVLHGVRDFWGNYFWLRGVRRENETLRQQGPTSKCGCRNKGRWPPFDEVQELLDCSQRRRCDGRGRFHCRIRIRDVDDYPDRDREASEDMAVIGQAASSDGS